MKNNVCLLYCFLCIIIVNLGCKKILDEKPAKNLAEPKTIKDLQAILDYHSKMNDDQPSYDLSSTDDLFITDENYASLDGVNKDAYIWENFNYANLTEDWSSLYKKVNIANIVLEHIKKITPAANERVEWGNVKGSALVYRAYAFLRAVWIYSKAYDETTASEDLGIAVRTVSDFNIPSIRASVKESYERIINDLKDAGQLLPDLPSHPFRPSRQAAYALLARTYLSMRKYDSAYKYSNLSLQIRSDLLDYKTLSNIDGSRPFPNFSVSPFNPEVIFLNTLSNNFIYLFDQSISNIDSVLYSNYQPGDLRKRAFFKASSSGFSFKGSYWGLYELFAGPATDEMYLVRAECAARAGNTTVAMSDLNTLLINRWDNTFVPLTAATPQEALSIILTERRKELLFRDLRWSDIKRLNKEGANIVLRRVVNGQTYGLMPNENRYALPLPEPVVDLGGMPQNPR